MASYVPPIKLVEGHISSILRGVWGSRHTGAKYSMLDFAPWIPKLVI